MKYTPKTKPFPHQSRAVVRAVKARNYGIFFEPRLGKTKTALDYVGVLALKGECQRVLILAPNIALSVWEEEIPRHFPFRWRCEDFDNYWDENLRDDAGDMPAVHFFLAGRERTMRAQRVNHRLVRPRQQEVEEWGPDVIIIDESHEYKRPGGRGAQDAWRMVRRLRERSGNGRPYVLLLSGTPNPKGWRDLFSQFRIMDDSIFGTNAQLFDEDYVIYGHGSRRYSVVGYRDEKKILKKVRAHSISVSAAEAGLDNEQFWNSIKVNLPPAAKKAYLDIATDMVTELEEGVFVDAKNAGVRRLRLLQIAGGFAGDPPRQLHAAKLEATQRYLESLLEAEESVVVYARFLPEVAALGDTASSVGYRTTVIQGSTKREDRLRAIRRFQSVVGRPQALVFQIQTGKQSIELSRAAEVIYYSTPDGWVEYWQSLNRVRGPNQHRPVRYTHIVARGTVDLAAWEGLRKKEDWHQTLMRNPRRYLTPL